MNEAMHAKLLELLDSHAESQPGNPKVFSRAQFLEIVNTLNLHARVPYRSATVELSRKIKLKTHLISELEKKGYVILD